MKELSRIDAAELYEKALALMNAKNSDADLKKVAQLLDRSWRMGEPRAAYALGTWYLYGANGFKKDTKKGIALITEAANAKVPSALYDLAACYEKGEGISRDLSRAFLFYLDAALRGDNEALAEVGRCYFYGIGTTQSFDIAEIWNARAEELGTFREDNDVCR